MSLEGSAVQSEGRYVHANGIDIHYVEAGQGEPLLLLHGGVVSTNPVWAGHPWAWVSHMATLAGHFRVIAPDTRGHGRTVNAGGGSIPYTRLADDVVGLIDALGLDRPMICGFSDGAMTATIVGIRHPGSVRAIVNYAGYDTLHPQAPSMPMMRQNLSLMRAMFNLVKADHDGAQGNGYWKTLLAEASDRFTQPPGCTLEDLRKITAPTLILTGDRDELCTVEEGAAAYRMLQQGELAVLPNHAHVISPSVVEVIIEFLERHRLARRPAPASS